MPDDSELIGLDPYDCLDEEAARLDRYFSNLDDAGWARPSRCAGWSVRDVLAHLVSAEDYHRACLHGKVGELMRGLAEKGGTDIARANEIGIAELAARSTGELLTEWRAANAETRRGFRERNGDTVDTSVGQYPCRWQAFHVASELAVHADDVYVIGPPTERDARRDWRVRFSRFALAEDKPDLDITVRGGRTLVRGHRIEIAVDDDELIEGVAARLDNSSRLDARARDLLSATP